MFFNDYLRWWFAHLNSFYLGFYLKNLRGGIHSWILVYNLSEVRWSAVKSDEIRGILPSPMNSWIPTKFGEFQWIPVNSSEVKWISVKYDEFRWNLMNSDEVRWSSAKFDEFRWSPMNFGEVRWNLEVRNVDIYFLSNYLLENLL